MRKQVDSLRNIFLIGQPSLRCPRFCQHTSCAGGNQPSLRLSLEDFRGSLRGRGSIGRSPSWRPATRGAPPAVFAHICSIHSHHSLQFLPRFRTRPKARIHPSLPLPFIPASPPSLHPTSQPSLTPFTSNGLCGLYCTGGDPWTIRPF